MSRATTAIIAVLVLVAAVAVVLWQPWDSSTSVRNQEDAGRAVSDPDPDAGRARPVRIHAGTLDDPRHRDAIDKLVEAFNDHSEYKGKAEVTHFKLSELEEKLGEYSDEERPDVLLFLSGHRMREMARQKKLESVSDLWGELGGTPDLSDTMTPWRSAMTVGDEQYGVPYSAYHWVLYYRKDIFENPRLPVRAPDLWDYQEMKNACRALRREGIALFAIGTRFPGPAAGWFDYLDLRLNGLDFHTKLMADGIKYHDEIDDESIRVRKVFEEWKELVELGCFLPNHEEYTWIRALDLMKQGKAAMFLFSNGMLADLEESERSNYRVAPFPIIDPKFGRHNVAPVETMHIPANPPNQEGARAFLAFAATQEMQSMINNHRGLIPPHIDATLDQERYPLEAASADIIHERDEAARKRAEAARESGETAPEKGKAAQFYIREANPDMIDVGSKAFREFMLRPKRLNRILERLEKKRLEILDKRAGPGSSGAP